MRNGKKVRQPKRERGRPQKLDESDLPKIRELASAGLTLPEMASIMGVSRTAIETLLKNSLDLKDEIQGLRQRPKALAKLIVIRELESGSVDLAKWVLERSSKLTSERERLALMRAQRKALEPSKESLPDALPPGAYWERVNAYFTHRDDPKPESTEAESSDKDGDQTSTADPGDQTNKTDD